MKISKNHQKGMRNRYDNLLFQNKTKMSEFRLVRIMMHCKSYEDFTKHIEGFKAHEKI